MVRTQIQIPDILYKRAKSLAMVQEVSLAEIVRNGLEYILRVSQISTDPKQSWKLPEGLPLGDKDFCSHEDWRADLHCRLAEDPVQYKKTKNPKNTKKSKK